MRKKPPEEPLTENAIIETAITIIGATQTANEGGDPELVMPVLDKVMKRPELAQMLLWKFASEIGVAMRRGNPDTPWPVLVEGLRGHWLQQNDEYKERNPEE